MTLEGGLTALERLEWDLGGLLISGNENATNLDILCVYDDGLDGIGEVTGDDEELYGDGVAMGHQRLTSRAVTLGLSIVAPSDDEDEKADQMEALLASVAKVMDVLPNSHTATRRLRYRRSGGPAKRLYYRPAQGVAVEVPGNEERHLYGGADVVVRLECPDPRPVSDEYHQEPFTAGQTKTITNAGTSTAKQPCAWSLTASSQVAIENLDFDEYVLFPGTSITVNRDRTSTSSTGYGISYGHAGRLYPRWPLLRPGANQIKASAACTFTWRDTY